MEHYLVNFFGDFKNLNPKKPPATPIKTKTKLKTIVTGFIFLIAFFIWLVLLANLKSFNKPYLYPLIPFNIKKLYKVLIRFPYRNKK